MVDKILETETFEWTYNGVTSIETHFIGSDEHLPFDVVENIYFNYLN